MLHVSIISDIGDSENLFCVLIRISNDMLMLLSFCSVYIDCSNKHVLPKEGSLIVIISFNSILVPEYLKVQQIHKHHLLNI